MRMSDVDKGNETNGVSRLESGCNDGVDCAHSGGRVRALRRRAPKERNNVLHNSCGGVARRVPHAARGGKPGRASGLGIAGACSASSAHGEALSVDNACQRVDERLRV